VREGQPESCHAGDVALARLGATRTIEGEVSASAETIWLGPTSAPPGVCWGAVLGLALPHLVYARGSHLLHASCVSLGGGAVAFLGAPRSGKSSTAAALLRHGWRLVSDDALPVIISEGGVLAQPAFPAIRLFTPTARLFAGGDRERPVPIHPRVPKCWVHVDQAREWHSSSPLPLRCLCLLDRSGAPSARLFGRHAILTVLGASYQSPAVDPRRLDRDFDVVHRLAATIPVVRLAVPQEIPPLDRLGDRVLTELAALGGP
jgi:hypothetical protein